MKSRKWMWIEITMLLVWLVTVVLFLQAVYSDGAQCKANPLVFGVEALEEKNNAEFMCSCSFENEPGFAIEVNSDGWELVTKTVEGVDVRTVKEYPTLNLTEGLVARD